MKGYLFQLMLILFSFLFTNCDLMGEPITQKGIFGCILDGYMVFFTNHSSDGESPYYDLKIMDLSTKTQKVIAQNLPISHCEKLSGCEFTYTNGIEIICYNTKDERSKSIVRANINNKIVGFKGTTWNDSLLVIEVDYKNNKALTKVLSIKAKIVLFEKTINLNKSEMEGILPICFWLKDAFVFSLQDKLYSIDFKKPPEVVALCNHLDGFAIDNLSIILYQFITDEKTEARYINSKTLEISSNIDQSLDQKIYNCTSSNIFSALHNGKYVSYYIICSIPYLLVDNKWEKVQEVILFEDSQSKVSFTGKNGTIDKTNFIYTNKE